MFYGLLAIMADVSGITTRTLSKILSTSEQTLGGSMTGTYQPPPRTSSMELHDRCLKAKFLVEAVYSTLCVGIAVELTIMMPGKLWAIQVGAGQACCLTS